MKLSVIIVNYNVRYFLEHCLDSVNKSISNHEIEIIVVDNSSSDGSLEMMAKRFPSITYLFQNENLGFSKANNIGINHSTGEYVLLLNPDTVVREDTFEKCISFMDKTADCGGLGIHMIDGNGHFLPESKRGLPTPSAAFFKIFGFSRLFPTSKKFGKYHLGFLNEYETNEIEVLSGAYMMMRRSILEKSGLLDEAYFMYGEDIDLSYKIIKSGYKNYYLPKAEIIHYKGESTKKGSVNYVFVFYRAMIIFAKKHFEKGQASLFGALINLAIYFRAFIALLSRVFGRTWQLLLDFTFIYASFLFVSVGYEQFQHKDFSLPFVSIALPAYSIIMVGVLLFSGAYDRPNKPSKLIQGWLIASLVLLAFYALLPEAYRFSRAVILFASPLAFLLGFFWRIILKQIPEIKEELSPRIISRRLVIGSAKSLELAQNFIAQEKLLNDFLAGVCVENSHPVPLGFIGDLNFLESTVNTFSVHELIFCTDDLSNGQIIDLIKKHSHLNLEMTIASKDFEFLIGSQKVIKPHAFNETRSLRDLNLSSINRTKRLLDILTSLIFMITFPITALIVDDLKGFAINLAAVISGKRSWVGLDARGISVDLPKVKDGVIHPLSNVILGKDQIKLALSENVNYLLKFNAINDIKLIIKHYQLLGNP